MLCSNCSKLATQQTNKKCNRCQASVYINVFVLCDQCSNSSQQCAVCLKKIIPLSAMASKKGCNCGGK